MSKVQHLGGIRTAQTYTRAQHFKCFTLQPHTAQLWIACSSLFHDWRNEGNGVITISAQPSLYLIKTVTQEMRLIRLYRLFLNWTRLVSKASCQIHTLQQTNYASILYNQLFQHENIFTWVCLADTNWEKRVSNLLIPWYVRKYCPGRLQQTAAVSPHRREIIYSHSLQQHISLIPHVTADNFLLWTSLGKSYSPI